MNKELQATVKLVDPKSQLGGTDQAKGGTMKTIIVARIKGTEKKKPKKLELIRYKASKKSVELEVELDRESTHFYDTVSKEVTSLGLGTEAMRMDITITDARAIGRLVNRSVNAFKQLDIEISSLGWEDKSGLVQLTGNTLTVSDFPFLVEVWLRMAQRATRVLSHTQHPLTLFDLKQAISLIYDAKQGLPKADELLKWFKTRHLAYLRAHSAQKTKKEVKKAKKTKEKTKTATLIPS